jgi:hypothetical protein
MIATHFFTERAERVDSREGPNSRLAVNQAKVMICELSRAM